MIKHGLIKKAEKYLKRYIKKFGLSEVEKSLYVSSLALSMNFRNDEIEKNVYICNELNKQMENNSLYNLIKDKKIAIVGSSDECIGKNLGDEIDGHDLVVRFNHYKINGYENDYGKRVDIHCVNLSNNNKISDDVTTLAVITGVPFNYFFNTGMKKFSDFSDFINGNLGTRKSLYNCPPLYDLAHNYKIFIPTSGLIFIYHVYQLLGNLNNVKIYGFDFLKDKPSYSLNHYYDNLDNSKVVYWGGHDIKMEGKLLNYLYKKN